MELADGFGVGPVTYRSADAGVAQPETKGATLTDGFGGATAPSHLDRLNFDQKKIVKSKAKRKLVLAGAGTGKTSGVLLPSCEELYTRMPGKIGIFSFGVAIKEELEEKIHKQLSPMAAAKTKVMTNHGLGLSLVMRNLETLGLPADTHVEGTLWKIIAWFRDQARAESGLSASARSPHFRLEFNQLTDPQSKALLAIEENLIANGKELSEENITELMRSYKVVKDMSGAIGHAFIHWARMQRILNGKLMFRDLLPLAAQLPEEAFKQLYFKHILVDEAQDLSADQHAVIRKLSSVVASTLFVGDAAQCIYRFSGSRPDLFIGIAQSYDDVEQFTMGVNYRCDEPILDLANHILSKVINSPVRLSPPEDRQGDSIEYGTATGTDLVAWIRRRMAAGELPRDMAVLTRTNSQLLSVELALTKAEITYNCWGGSLFEHKAVDDFLVYIRLLAGERTYSDWEKIVSHVPFLGKKTAEEVWEISQGNPLNLPSGWYPSTVRGDKAKMRWFDLMKRLRGLRQEMGVANSGWPLTLATDLKVVWAERWADDPEKVLDAEDIAEVFSDWATSVGDPEALLDKVETMSVQDPNGVVLTTLHKFKGLERNSVAIWNIGINNPKVRGLFPLGRGDFEEEASIFYVAVTRARHNLILLKNAICDWPYGIGDMFCKTGLLFAQHGTQNPCIMCPHQFQCLATLGTI